MKIKELHVDYKVIREATFNNLSDLVVVAGPNGVGKTKVVEAIVSVFQSGNPPGNCKITLEATNQEELDSWGSETITLPNQTFWGLFSRRRRKIKTSARLINIDAGRQIESVHFQQMNLNQIGNPELEEVDFNYGANKIRDRFQDICQTLWREKARLLTSLGSSAYEKFRESDALATVTVTRPDDITKKFEVIFEQLLYPKKMEPIEVDSSTIQFIDDAGATRSFQELSSGEREAIVLAFDIMLQNPADSIIVIDEPELHLHPELTFRLVKVLRSIGERNQIFLFTHSTDIISNSFETGIHFIRPKAAVKSGNQVVRVDTENIGDLKSVPNLREAIGMISLGKKLLFVEGTATSIDRNIFATLAKSEEVDLAIVASDSCHNVTNMALIADSLKKGLFGIDLFMVRDRDSLTEIEVDTFTKKSSGKLMFLPFYHIENTFLVPDAIYHIYKKLVLTPIKTKTDIEQKLLELARQQINDSVLRYVSSEIRFKAGNFQTKITTQTSAKDTIDSISTIINDAKNAELSSYALELSDSYVSERVKFWKETLEKSVSSEWTEDARRYFYGKSLLNQLQQWLLGSKNISIWEHMINDEDVICKAATEPLREILRKV